MKKHLVVLFVYNNLEHIKTCFESLYLDEVDYFIVENKSPNSKEIEEYFKDKRLVGHICFEENISATAVNIFIKDYFETMREYEYVSISDGDIYVTDARATYKEIIDNLDREPSAFVSSIDLWLGNHYENESKVSGTNHLDWYMQHTTNVDGYKLGATACHLLTVKNQRLDIFQDIHFIDTILYNKVMNMGGRWISTLRNLAYHLTWDLYVEGNEYYEFKKATYPQIWDEKEPCDYDVLVPRGIMKASEGVFNKFFKG